VRRKLQDTLYLGARKGGGFVKCGRCKKKKGKEKSHHLEEKRYPETFDTTSMEKLKGRTEREKRNS